MKKFRVTVDGQTYEVEIEEIGNSASPSPETSPATSTSTGTGSSSPGGASTGNRTSTKQAPGSTAESGGVIEAPISGNVFDLKVSVGDSVEKGQVVVVLEAMKMENDIVADFAGTVKSIKAEKGATVNAGDPLIVLE